MYRYARSAFFFAFYYRELFPYLMPFVYPLALIAQTGSVYTTLAVTIERYIVICWPLRYAELIISACQCSKMPCALSELHFLFSSAAAWAV